MIDNAKTTITNNWVKLQHSFYSKGLRKAPCIGSVDANHQSEDSIIYSIFNGSRWVELLVNSPLSNKIHDYNLNHSNPEYEGTSLRNFWIWLPDLKGGKQPAWCWLGQGQGIPRINPYGHHQEKLNFEEYKSIEMFGIF